MYRSVDCLLKAAAVLLLICGMGGLIAGELDLTVPRSAVNPDVVEIPDDRFRSYSSQQVYEPLTSAFEGHGNNREPFGSERFSTEDDAIRVPEPLLFDLVRPLGARQGEIEFNTLASFPWSKRENPGEDDPFGVAPTSRDRKGIEWAPEVEFVLYDNFAIEFEFPFEDATLEEYKLGLQWTIGTAFDHRYVHGFQMLVEPSTDWRGWNTTLLYLGGIRFDERWSALFMVGGRVDLEGPKSNETFENLFNLSLFNDVTPHMSLGIETNYAAATDGSREFVVAP